MVSGYKSNFFSSVSDCVTLLLEAPPPQASPRIDNVYVPSQIWLLGSSRVQPLPPPQLQLLTRASISELLSVPQTCPAFSFLPGLVRAEPSTWDAQNPSHAPSTPCPSWCLLLPPHQIGRTSPLREALVSWVGILASVLCTNSSHVVVITCSI